MSTFVKVVLGMLVTLPLLAYTAGSLIASSADVPETPAPITVPTDRASEDDRLLRRDARREARQEQRREERREARREARREGASAPGERRGDRDNPPREDLRKRAGVDQDDDEPEVIRPEPDTIDDDDSDDSDSSSGDDD